MMALYLVQHGKSLPADVDPDQGLSADGVAETERVARMAKDAGLSVKGILHSGKLRARRTAELLAASLAPPDGANPAQGLSPLDDVAPWMTCLNPDSDLMLVGHLPFLERLAALLVSGSIERPVIKFQNSGIVCLDRESSGIHWVIRWALVPRLG
jgi:phosphohistidine phosphatase